MSWYWILAGLFIVALVFVIGVAVGSELMYRKFQDGEMKIDD